MAQASRPHIPTHVLRTAQHIDNLSFGSEIQGSHCSENTLKCTKKLPNTYYTIPGNIPKDYLKCTKKTTQNVLKKPS